MSKQLHMETQEEQLAKEPTAISFEMAEKEYQFLGWANGWTKTPEEVQKCRELKHQRRQKSHDRRGLENTVVCDICKIYWKYDSSD